MSSQINKLTALKVKNLKHGDSASNKHTDGGGLYLFIHENGSKYWRLDYTGPTSGKRNTLACGVYPTITLEAARKRRDEVKRQIAEGNDPAEVRDHNKHLARIKTENTFQKIAEKWLEFRALEGKQDSENLRRLNKDIYPYIGDMPVNQLTTFILETEVINRIIDT